MRGYRVAAAAVFLAIVWLLFPSAVDQPIVPSQAAPPTHLNAPQAHPIPPPNLQLARAMPRYQSEIAQLVKQAAMARISGDFWLHGVGSQLYTAWNQPVTLKAMNWFGFEYAPFVPDGLDHASLDSILASLRALGFNALRLTFADQTVESNPVVTAGLNANPQFRGLRSLDIMQRIIERAHDFGLRVVLVNSRSEAGRGPELETGLWYTTQYPASAWMADWETLARRFRNDSAFVGADLRNEPHITGSVFDEQSYFRLGPLWGAYHGVYYHDRDWHYVAETLGDDLLAINPHLLIIVEGVQMYLDPWKDKMVGGLWGSNLEGVQYDPVVLSRPGQLVYSVHEYGPSMWQGNWFSPHTTYASLSKRWNRLWGYLLSAQRALQAPIFVGEFGTCHQYWACISSNQGWKQGFWFASFVRYLHAHPQVGWAYWALNPQGPFHATDVDYYSLVSPNWRHYFPLLTTALGPLLSEPSGLIGAYNHGGTPVMTPQPGCPAEHSCVGAAAGTALHTAGIAHPPSVTSVRVVRNVPYVNWNDPNRSGDLYLPAGPSAKPRPAVLVIHGPGWSQGQKGTPATEAVAQTLAWHGYVAYDINYRLAGQGGGYPRDIRDVKVAAAFLAANARKLGINPRQIAAVGSGSGGYLAMMAAYTPNQGRYAPRQGIIPARIAAVGSFFAPTDLEGIGNGAGDLAMQQNLSTYLHTTFAQNPAAYRDASPKTYDNRAVPTIFFHGTADTAEPFAQTFRLYRFLRQRSVTSELKDLSGAPHGFGDLTGSTRQQTMQQLANFFDGVFYQPPYLGGRSSGS